MPPQLADGFQFGNPNFAHFGILPGEQSLNLPMPSIPPDVAAAIGAAITGNWRGLLDSALAATSRDLWSIVLNPMIMDADDPRLSGNNCTPGTKGCFNVPSPSDLVKRDYQAFQQCVGDPYGPPSTVPVYNVRKSPWSNPPGPDFGSNGPGMGPDTPTLQPAIPSGPEFQYGKVADCMRKYPLSPLGGNVYMAPGDVF